MFGAGRARGPAHILIVTAPPAPDVAHARWAAVGARRGQAVAFNQCARAGGNSSTPGEASYARREESGSSPPAPNPAWMTIASPCLDPARVPPKVVKDGGVGSPYN